MLKAHSRFFEHVVLAADLVLVGGCWLAAYGLRFYVIGPPLVTPEPPPLADYLLQLVPILLVWGLAFRWFGLYRPRRLGSYFSEWLDIAKASTLGVLVLVAIMTFVFRRYEYSRVVIVYFWVLSIVATSFWRAAFRELLRARRGVSTCAGRSSSEAANRPARSWRRSASGRTWACRWWAWSATRTARRRCEVSDASRVCGGRAASRWSLEPARRTTEGRALRALPACRPRSGDRGGDPRRSARARPTACGRTRPRAPGRCRAARGPTRALQA